MIVADTNVISYLLLPTPFSQLADELYKKDLDWVAPQLWRSEFRNVLALYLRKELLSLDRVFQIQDYAESLMLHNEFEISSSQVLTLINNSSCSAYDCEFVALARHLSVTLVTEDKKIINEFPAVAMSISEYLKL